MAQLGVGREERLANYEGAFRLLESFGGATVDGVEVVSQTGARAVISVTVTVGGETLVEEVHLVRENGNWKLEL